MNLKRNGGPRPKTCAGRGWALVLLCLPLLAVAAGGTRTRPVVVAEAQVRELAPIDWYTGTVISREQARLAAEVTARLLWVADVGAQVERAAVVARLDDSLLIQEHAERQADVTRIEANLVFLREEVSRLQRLAKQNNAARSQLDKAVAERAAAQGELKAAQARERHTREELRRTQLRAPFAGVVTERLLHAGEWADEGEAVLAMTDPHNLEVQGWVSVSALPFIKDGDRLRMRIAGRDYQGQVRARVPVGDLRSRLYELRLTLPPGSWSVGESVRIAVPAAAVQSVLVVPRDALVLRRNAISLFTIDSENVANKIAVTTGMASGDYIEVHGELHPGDRVVIRGGERLRPGQTVTVQDPGSVQ